MKVGLARHFKIPHNQLKLLDREGFEAWNLWYDEYSAKVPPAPVNPGTWDLCYCSDLPRAVATAEKLFNGLIKKTPELREVPFGPVFRQGIKAPLLLWQALSRLGWALGHGSQPEIRRQTHRRVAGFLKWIREEHPDQNILLVSHGFLMQILEKELRKGGFHGRVSLRPHWGRVYTFTN